MREFGSGKSPRGIESPSPETNSPEYAPVHDMPDLPLRTRGATENPGDAYHMASHRCSEIAKGFIDSEQPNTSDSLDDLKYWVALESHLGPSLSAQRKIHSAEMGRFDKGLAAMQTHFAEKNVDLLDIVQTARELPKEKIWEHFLGELSNYRAYLAGEKTFPLDEQTGKPVKHTDIDYYNEVADILGVDAWQDTETDLPDKVRRGEALEQEVEKLTTLLLDENKTGLAISFARMIFDIPVSNALIDRIVSQLRDIREVEGEKRYRRVYDYATQTLNKDQLRRFLAHQPKEKPLTFGGKHEIIGYGENKVLSEVFEEGNLSWATLSDGTRIPMPSIDYVHRAILGYESGDETEREGRQGAVNYADLPEEAKQAVEIAIQVADEGRSRTETLPYYKRLAFWPDDEKGNQLYTVIFRDGDDRLMNFCPDHHGFVTSDTERKLDYPVKSATPVKDTYMVIPYSGSYMFDQTFRDADPNFFGPGEDKANAFWVMGNARMVYSKNDQRLTRENDGILAARFVIVPVRYYQIEEDRR